MGALHTESGSIMGPPPGGDDTLMGTPDPIGPLRHFRGEDVRRTYDLAGLVGVFIIREVQRPGIDNISLVADDDSAGGWTQPTGLFEMN